MEYLSNIIFANYYAKLYKRKFSEKEFQSFRIHKTNYLCECPYTKYTDSYVTDYIMGGHLHNRYVTDYIMGGHLHNRYGPARIQYTCKGEVLLEQYWIHGKKKSYSEWKKYVEVSSRYSRK